MIKKNKKAWGYPFFFLSVSFSVWFLGEGNSFGFEWHHEINVERVGLVQCEVPYETGKQTQVYVYDPKGMLIPCVARASPAEKKFDSRPLKPVDLGQNWEGGGMVLRFRSPPEQVDKMRVSFWGKNIESHEISIEMSKDGSVWETLLEHFPVKHFIDVGFRPVTGAYFRARTKKGVLSSPIDVRIDFSPATEYSPGKFVPIPFSVSPWLGHGTRIDFSLSDFNAKVDFTEIHTPDLAKILIYPGIFADIVSVGSKTSPGKAQRPTFDIFSPAQGGAPFLRLFPGGSMGFKSAVFLQSIDGRPIQISSVTIRSVPLSSHIFFEAIQKGTFTVLFGGQNIAISNGIIFGDRYNNFIDMVRSTKSFVNVRAGPLSPWIESVSHPEWGILDQPFDPKGYTHRRRLFLPNVGKHPNNWWQLKLPSPSPFEEPHYRGEDLRIVSNGKELPFIFLAPQNGKFIPGAQFEKSIDVGGVSRLKVKLPHSGMRQYTLRCIEDGYFMPRKARLRQSSRAPGQTGSIIAETMWSVGFREIQRPPDRYSKVVTPLSLSSRGVFCESDEIILEVDNGEYPPLSLRNIELLEENESLLFVAGAEDRIFIYYGNRDAMDPNYPIRSRNRPHNPFTIGYAELGVLETPTRRGWETDPFPYGKPRAKKIAPLFIFAAAFIGSVMLLIWFRRSRR